MNITHLAFLVAILFTAYFVANKEGFDNNTPREASSSTSSKDKKQECLQQSINDGYMAYIFYNVPQGASNQPIKKQNVV